MFEKDNTSYTRFHSRINKISFTCLKIEITFAYLKI